jgi:uncharacterized membrane-anchored protein YitT (DUF2179 family)
MPNIIEKDTKMRIKSAIFLVNTIILWVYILLVDPDSLLFIAALLNLIALFILAEE